jgi:hypothetical protein
VPVYVEGGCDVATIEPYAAKDVYDPPIYSQAVNVSGAQTILYIAGKVTYTPGKVVRRIPVISRHRREPRCNA